MRYLVISIQRYESLMRSNCHHQCRRRRCRRRRHHTTEGTSILMILR
jgi:hypothetical protein